MNGSWPKLGAGRLRKCLAALALIAVVARALVPVGFMPMVSHGETRIMFCHDGMPGHAAAADPASHSGHGTTEQPCSYATSAGAAPLPATIDFSLTHAAPEAADAPVVIPALIPAPARHAAPRGPPAQA